MSELDQAASPKKVPSWAAEPFSSFIRDLNRAVNFYSLTISGLSRIAKESQITDELKADIRRANVEIRKIRRSRRTNQGSIKACKNRGRRRIPNASSTGSALSLEFAGVANQRLPRELVGERA